MWLKTFKTKRALKGLGEKIEMTQTGMKKEEKRKETGKEKGEIKKVQLLGSHMFRHA